jgi:hypothetical protein
LSKASRPSDRVAAYVAYSIAADQLGAACDYGPEWDAYTAEHDPGFADVWETDSWWLVDQTGTRRAILVPNFHDEGAVSWRYDPRR